MPSLSRRLSLIALLILLAASLPAARPALAQGLEVNSLADDDDGSCNAAPGDCTLREAINAANSSAAANTITFSVSGTIAPTSPLPPLSGGGDTINAGANHTVVLSGQNLASAVPVVASHGLRITSANNTVRGLVIIGFPRGTASSVGGSGIFISGTGATGNKIYDNWIGVTSGGTTAAGNQLFGVLLDDGASNNDIGGTAAGQPNTISGNLVANVAVRNVSLTDNLISNNRIVGNRIGTNVAGTAVIDSANTAQLEAGVLVERYAVDTVIRANLIGGHTGNSVVAGIIVFSDVTTSDAALRARIPRDTQIVGNRIGVNETGTAIPNRVGVVIGAASRFTPLNTVIGDPANLAGGRNYIAGNSARGVQIPDGVRGGATTVTIVGNHIGLAPSGARVANGTAGDSNTGEGIWIGVSAPADGVVATVGPGNVIAASRLFHIRVRSSNNAIKGNLIGTDPAGSTTSATSASTSATVGYGSGDAAIYVENGSGNLIGGPTAADRNIIANGGIALSGSGGSPVMLDPRAANPSGNNCLGACVVSANTIQGNYLGVAANGTGKLNTGSTVSVDGLRLRNTTDNIARDNVISGVGRGILLDSNANNNQILNNRIGTRADGSTGGIGINNNRDGIKLISGSGNRFEGNTIAFNGSDNNVVLNFHGIYVGSGSTTANDNQFIRNTIVRNGRTTFAGHGIFLENAQRNLISETVTSGNAGSGIAFSATGTPSNGGLAAPTLNTPAGAAASITGSAPGCPSGCTVELFTGSGTLENGEGPVFLRNATTSGGAFSVSLAGCLSWVTATVREAGGNTSPFSNAVDVGSSCAPPANVSLSLASGGDQRDVVIGSSTIYTHTLSHTSAVERTYTISISSSRGWATGPSSVTVPANGSAQLAVTVAVPAGTPVNTSDSTTVQASFGGVSSEQRTNQTRAVAAPQPDPAFPVVSPGITRPIGVGQGSVAFTHTVTNTGDLTGTFSVVGQSLSANAPATWSVGTITWGEADRTLDGGETSSLTIIVNTPGPLPAGDVTLSFRVRADNGQQSDPLTVDTIDVPLVRSFSFAANPPTSQSSAANASLSYTYTITNTGNNTDTFQIVPPAATSPASGITFSANPNSSFSLAARATRTVTVTASIPANTPVNTYNFTVTAQGVGGVSPPGAQQAAGSITVTGGGAPIFVGAPTVSPAQAQFETSTLVTVTFGLRNGGNAPANFVFPAPTLPPGWTLQGQSDTCPDPVPTAASGTTCTLTLVVQVPAGQSAGNYTVIGRATAINSPLAADTNASANATVPVETARGLSFTPTPLSDDILPGGVVTFTHTLENTGNAPDSFSFEVAQSASPAWTVTIDPPALSNIPRDATRGVTVTVTAPLGVLGGASNTITVTARSQGSPAVSAAVTDTVTVLGVDGADLEPGRTRTGQAGTSISFSQTLTNTGSTAIAYRVEAENSQAGWAAPLITSPNPTAVLNPGETTTVTVGLSIPPDTSGISNTLTLRVFADGTSEPVLDSEESLILVGDPFDVLVDPDRVGTVLPNFSQVFTHTVTNIGISSDTYELSVVEANRLPVFVGPTPLSLGPGESQVISVTVVIPAGVRAGTPGFARVRATSTTDRIISDTATIDFTVAQQAGLDLSAPQIRRVAADSGQISLDSLSLRNTGNALDTFDLTFESIPGEPGGLAPIISPTSVTVDKGDIRRSISVQVTVPSTVPAERIRKVRVVARSRFDPTKTDSVVLELAYQVEPRTVPSRKLYLPYLAR